MYKGKLSTSQTSRAIHRMREKVLEDTVTSSVSQCFDICKSNVLCLGQSMRALYNGYVQCILITVDITLDIEDYPIILYSDVSHLIYLIRSL